MDTRRNFANIERNMTGNDGQALQHFMSNSPWSGQEVFGQIQDDIKATEALVEGSALILDESADEKAGMHNAGASRQYNGRMGKVDVCRVDTCLCYANTNVRGYPRSRRRSGSRWTSTGGRPVCRDAASVDRDTATAPSGPPSATEFDDLVVPYFHSLVSAQIKVEHSPGQTAGRLKVVPGVHTFSKQLAELGMLAHQFKDRL